MTSKWIGRTVTVAVWMAMGVGRLGASGKITSRWSELCTVSLGSELSLVSTSGKTVKGQCASTGESDISLNNHGRLLKMERSDVSKIRMLRLVNHHLLPALGNQVGELLFGGLLTLASPYAPLGLVIVPAALVYGAAAAPVCAAHDLAQKIFHGRKSVEIVVQ
jgi:hypothetical protein